MTVTTGARGRSRSSASRVAVSDSSSSPYWETNSTSKPNSSATVRIASLSSRLLMVAMRPSRMQVAMTSWGLTSMRLASSATVMNSCARMTLSASAGGARAQESAPRPGARPRRMPGGVPAGGGARRREAARRSRRRRGGRLGRGRRARALLASALHLVLVLARHLLAHGGAFLRHLGLHAGDGFGQQGAHVVLDVDAEPPHDLQHRLARHAEILGHLVDAQLLRGDLIGHDFPPRSRAARPQAPAPPRPRTPPRRRTPAGRRSRLPPRPHPRPAARRALPSRA